VIASCVLLGGYVEIEDQAFLSGGVLVHQFSKVGRLAMVSGNTRVNLDAPPYFTYSGFAIQPRGLNIVGLKRAGYGAPQVSSLKQAYRFLYRSGLKLEEALARIEGEIPTPETLHLAGFIRSSRRGIARE
jgi:UDP-N-acetylglucosamine acyltransferase